MLLCFLATVAAASAADGSKFSISNTLGSHAVLQNPVIIWGYGVPGESISTTVAQDQVSLNVLIGLLLHRSGHAKWTCSWPSRPRFLYPPPPHLVNRFVVVYTLCMSPHYSHSHASSSLPSPFSSGTKRNSTTVSSVLTGFGGSPLNRWALSLRVGRLVLSRTPLRRRLQPWKPLH